MREGNSEKDAYTVVDSLNWVAVDADDLISNAQTSIALRGSFQYNLCHKDAQCMRCTSRLCIDISQHYPDTYTSQHYVEYKSTKVLKSDFLQKKNRVLSYAHCQKEQLKLNSMVVLVRHDSHWNLVKSIDENDDKKEKKGGLELQFPRKLKFYQNLSMRLQLGALSRLKSSTYLKIYKAKGTSCESAIFTLSIGISHAALKSKLLLHGLPIEFSH